MDTSQESPDKWMRDLKLPNQSGVGLACAGSARVLRRWPRNRLVPGPKGAGGDHWPESKSCRMTLTPPALPGEVRQGQDTHEEAKEGPSDKEREREGTEVAGIARR